MISKLPKQEIIINQLSPTETRWFAVYTKYKCEKYVADQLSKKISKRMYRLFQKQEDIPEK